MRYLVLFILLSSFATAYYSGEVYEYEGVNYTFTLHHTESALVAARIDDYQEAKEISDEEAREEAIEDALEELEEAIAIAKRSDRINVHDGSSGVVILFDTCADLNGQPVCFTEITYYEEDASPLGDGRLDSVKFVDGKFLLPFNVEFGDLASSTIFAKRTLSDNTVYPLEKVTVTLTVSNTGTASSGRLSIIDIPPLPVTSGETTIELGSLSADAVKQAVYFVTPKEAGVYTFTAHADGATIEDSTLTVLAAVTVNTSATALFAGESGEFTFNVTNTYQEDISFKAFTIEATTALKSCDVPSSPRGTMERVFNVELEKGDSIVIRCMIEPSAGAHTATLELRADAIGQQRHVLNLAVLRRDLVITPTLDGNTLSLFLQNDLTERLDDITINYGDGSEESLLMKPGSNVTVKHTYTQSATLTVTYADEEKQFPIVINGQTPSIPLEEQANPETPTEPTNPETETEQTPETPSTAPAEPSVAETEEKGLVKEFLDWLSSFFH